MSQRIVVTVENDHLETLARPTRSLAGIAELIWNALDAEADSVAVTLTDNGLGGVGSVRVADDGHGMRHADALEEFAHLGGSWKLHATHSKNHKRLCTESVARVAGGRSRSAVSCAGSRLREQTESTT